MARTIPQDSSTSKITPSNTPQCKQKAKERPYTERRMSFSFDEPQLSCAASTGAEWSGGFIPQLMT